MKLSLVVIVCVLAFVVAAQKGPARPVIPSQWYAEVHIAINDNHRFLDGGGIIALDLPNNMGRSDFKLENEGHQIETMHILERYDLHEIYEIVDAHTCKTFSTTGNITNPFDWVAKANYNGTNEYHGQQHDVWTLTLGDSGNVWVRTLYVDPNDVNTPVYFTAHNVTNGVVYDTAVDFLSFKAEEPKEWVFNIPTTCNSSLLRSPQGCNSGAVVYWANANWNCGNVQCSYRVPEGSGQPGYECAEFTARSLAAGGYMLNLQPTDPQSSYANFRGYNLCLVSGLSGFCGGVGYTAKPASASSVQAAYAVMGNGGDGPWSHACIGIGPGRDDCHNNARQNWPSSGSFYGGVNAVWAPPGC